MKKKTFLKISIAVIVALVTLFAMNVQVFASITSSANTSTITVTDLEAGVTATLYQIITVNYDYTADQPKDPEFTWVSSLASWVSSNYSNYIDSTDYSVTTNFTESSSEDFAAFYSALSRDIKDGSITITAYDSQTTSGTASYANSTKTGSSVSFSRVEMGQYVILVSGGYRVYSPATASVVPTYLTDSSAWVIGDGDDEADSTDGITVSAKSVPVSISKTVENEVSSYSTADEATFTITAQTIEYDAKALNTTYVITDVLGTGLSLENVTVYGVGSSDVSLTSGTDYTVTSNTDSSTKQTTLTVTITDKDLLSKYTSIKVVYTATFNVGASLDYTNTATLTYSSDQYTENASDVSISDTSSTVTIYFYGIDIAVKDSDGGALVGASFTLTDSGGNKVYFAYVDGVYYVVESSYSDATTEVTSTSSGISIQGLSVGTYTLTQTKAASGYLVNTSTVSLTLTDGDLDGKLDDDSDNTYELSIANSTGFSLPITGGVGTVIFVVVGIVLVGLGIGLIVVSSKKRMNK